MLARQVFDFLRHELKNLSGNYLEIGVYNGDGCFELSKLFPDKIIFAVDPFIEDGYTSHISKTKKGDSLNSQRTTALNYFKERSNIKFFETTSLEFHKSLDNAAILDYNISTVFIDGDHSFEGATIDYQLALDVIGNKEGIIIFDDTNLAGVAKAVAVFKEKFSSKIQIINENNGVSYFRILKNE